MGSSDALVGIDGEMRAIGLRPDGEAWTIAVEAPDAERRTPHSILALQDAAVATSGDYRHWVEVQGRRLSHTMDPRRGAPLIASPASVTVVARTCAEADAWATALMVLGPGQRRGTRKTNAGSTPCSSCAMMTAAQGAWESDDFFPKSQRQSPQPRGDEPHGTDTVPTASRPPSCCWPRPA